MALSKPLRASSVTKWRLCARPSESWRISLRSWKRRWRKLSKAVKVRTDRRKRIKVIMRKQTSKDSKAEINLANRILSGSLRRPAVKEHEAVKASEINKNKTKVSSPPMSPKKLNM